MPRHWCEAHCENFREKFPPNIIPYQKAWTPLSNGARTLLLQILADLEAAGEYAEDPTSPANYVGVSVSPSSALTELQTAGVVFDGVTAGTYTLDVFSTELAKQARAGGLT